MKLLFICTKNTWRGPTDEKVYKDSADLNVRSAGISRSALRAYLIYEISIHLI